MNQESESTVFESVLARFNNDFAWYYLPVPDYIADRIEYRNGTRRVVCKFNGAIEIQCALIPRSAGGFFVVVNKRIRDKLHIIEGDTVEVEMAPDRSKYGLPMPDEFSEVLRQDSEGDRLFHALTPGRQRSLIYLIGKTKDIDRRIHLALTIIQHLKDNNGRINPDRLAEELKRPVY